MMIGCGPIAFNDTINFKLAQPDPVVEAAPVSHAKLAGDHIIIDGKIQFGHDSAVLERPSYELLDDVVKLMQDTAAIEQLDIIGHTSSEGSKSHNNKLSAERAEAVKNYMIEHGVAAERMMSEGKGPSEPIADNDTDEGREKNRRVEFKVTQMAGAEPAAEDTDAKQPARGRPGAK